MRSIVATLTPASGRQDHTTSPSARQARSSARPRVHRIPHSTFVTIAIRPSDRGGTAGINKAVSSKRRSEIFFTEGLDRCGVRRGFDLPDGLFRAGKCGESRGRRGHDLRQGDGACGEQKADMRAAFACRLAIYRSRGSLQEFSGKGFKRRSEGVGVFHERAVPAPEHLHLCPRLADRRAIAGPTDNAVALRPGKQHWAIDTPQ